MTLGSALDFGSSLHFHEGINTKSGTNYGDFQTGPDVGMSLR